jgi:tetratricopeptide (TPR) repeat protein
MMIRSRHLLPLLLALAVASPLAAQRRAPVPSSEAQQRKIQEGIAIHDRQAFDSAIVLYLDVLRENPDNVEALYELSYAYLEKEDYQKAAETASRGTEYDSDILPLFYVTLGTSYDALRQPQRAIDAYERGIKDFPANYLLHYNAGVTYASMKRYSDARDCFMRAMAARPDHPSSHFGLGNIFILTRYRVPAICALSRFLVLEPGSTRSDAALASIRMLLTPPVQGPPDTIMTVKGKKLKKKPVSLIVAGLAKIGEGDFTAVEQALVKGTGRAIDTMGEKSELDRALDKFKIIFGTLAAAGRKAGAKPSFVNDFYQPYFVELYRKGYVEPFSYYIFQSSGDSRVHRWLKANDDWVREFIAWSEHFTWPVVER